MSAGFYFPILAFLLISLSSCSGSGKTGGLRVSVPEGLVDLPFSEGNLSLTLSREGRFFRKAYISASLPMLVEFPRSDELCGGEDGKAVLRLSYCPGTKESWAICQSNTPHSITGIALIESVKSFCTGDGKGLEWHYWRHGPYQALEIPRDGVLFSASWNRTLSDGDSAPRKPLLVAERLYDWFKQGTDWKTRVLTYAWAEPGKISRLSLPFRPPRPLGIHAGIPLVIRALDCDRFGDDAIACLAADASPRSRVPFYFMADAKDPKGLIYSNGKGIELIKGGSRVR